jgi:hypothetical protein
MEKRLEMQHLSQVSYSTEMQSMNPCAATIVPYFLGTITTPAAIGKNALAAMTRQSVANAA